ncbi:hypothetical protein D9M70_387870 [compost metagenome]
MARALLGCAVPMLAEDLDLVGTDGPSLVEYAMHADTLARREVGMFAAGEGGVVAHVSRESAQFDAVALLRVHQAFNQRLAGTPTKRQPRIDAGFGHFQRLAVPGAADQHLGAARQRLAQRQPLQLAGSLDGADGAGLGQLGRPIDAAGNHFALGIAQAAHPYRFTDAQALGHPCPRRDSNRLAHYLQGGGSIRGPGHRAFIGVENRNAPGLQAPCRSTGFHCNHLADGQAIGTGRHAVFAERNLVVEVHFNAVDANGAEASDGADDARATNAAVARRRARAADTAMRGRSSGATDAAVLHWRAGAPHSAGRHRARAAHAAGIEAGGRCVRGRNGDQQWRADQGQGAQHA